jgi:hypothetical protein
MQKRGKVGRKVVQGRGRSRNKQGRKEREGRGEGKGPGSTCPCGAAHFGCQVSSSSNSIKQDIESQK